MIPGLYDQIRHSNYFQSHIVKVNRNNSVPSKCSFVACNPSSVNKESLWSRQFWRKSISGLWLALSPVYQPNHLTQQVRLPWLPAPLLACSSNPVVVWWDSHHTTLLFFLLDSIKLQPHITDLSIVTTTVPNPAWGIYDFQTELSKCERCSRVFERS